MKPLMRKIMLLMVVSIASCWSSTSSGPATTPAPAPAPAALKWKSMAVPDHEIMFPEESYAAPSDYLPIAHRYVKRNGLALEECYTSALEQTPGLAGVLTTKFTVGLDGKVSAASASGIG